MRKILVVEDSPVVVKVLKHMFTGYEQFVPYYASSYREARALVEDPQHNFFAALVDLHLPDAADGEVVDFTLSQHISTVVLTGRFDEARREALLAKGIVDYVIKEGLFSYEYAFAVLNRLVKNQRIKVLVVDDSGTARKFVRSLLRLHLFQVYEAVDGVQAIKILLEKSDIKLLITDYNMPRMDGCELVKNIRLKYEKSDLVIIGLSSDNEGTLSARFIKNGANDFLRKPFHHEEFYCRVNHNVEFIELIESIRDSANRDELTGAYSRQYILAHGEKLLAESRRESQPLSAAVIDLDGFHHINDRYGSEIGDGVIKALTQEFKAAFKRFVFARASGKEFYVLMLGLSNEQALSLVEGARRIICSSPIMVADCEVEVSFSAGVTTIAAQSVDELFSAASVCLHRAKDAGGDLVLGDD